MIVSYLLSFLDRANIGNARLAGMEKDLGMTGKGMFSSVQPWLIFSQDSSTICRLRSSSSHMPYLSLLLMLF